MLWVETYRATHHLEGQVYLHNSAWDTRANGLERIPDAANVVFKVERNMRKLSFRAWNSQTGELWKLRTFQRVKLEKKFSVKNFFFSFFFFLKFPKGFLEKKVFNHVTKHAKRVMWSLLCLSIVLCYDSGFLTRVV